MMNKKILFSVRVKNIYIHSALKILVSQKKCRFVDSKFVKLSWVVQKYLDFKPEYFFDVTDVKVENGSSNFKARFCIDFQENIHIKYPSLCAKVNEA